MSESAVQLRIVPGAPPPLALSKNQKKRRRAKKPEGGDSPVVEIPDSATAALVETAPETADIEQGSVAPELLAQPEPSALEIDLKPSPIVELINKRLKATAKKIARIQTYAATDADKLNEDQKATLKTLPALEAVQKELGEVKKAVEAHEAELAHELAAQKIAAVKAEKAKIDAAVLDVQNTLAGRTAEIFVFLRLRSLLGSGELQATQIEENELNAIFAASDILLSDDVETKQVLVNGFLHRIGEFQGVPYTRLVELPDQILNPPHAPTPTAASSDQETNLADSQLTTDPQPDASVGGVPSLTPSSSFHFMQASEIESFEENVEWVERQDAMDPEAQAELSVSIPSANGHATPPEEGLNSAAIDWAADDDEGLPSLPSLQAKFGTSGTATPVTPAGDVPEEDVPVNGYDHEISTPVEEGGFTQARGRGRGGRPGRGRGGFRGGERGRGRGEFRGPFPHHLCIILITFTGRGRGEWRGDGFRGRGGRGGYRGGERGGGV